METSQQGKKTFYDYLGIESTASQAEIRSAYMHLAKKLHPDVSEEEAVRLLESDEEDLTVTRAFKLVTFAYHTLKDPKLREEYDKTLNPVYNGWGGKRTDPLMEKMARQNNSAGKFGQLSDEEDEESTQELIEPLTELNKKRGFFARLFRIFG